MKILSRPPHFPAQAHIEKLVGAHRYVGCICPQLDRDNLLLDFLRYAPCPQQSKRFPVATGGKRYRREAALAGLALCAVGLAVAQERVPAGMMPPRPAASATSQASTGTGTHPNAFARDVVPDGRPIQDRLESHDDHREFRFEAKSGAHLVVSVEGEGGIRATLVSPSGAEEGGAAGVIFDGMLAETGSYLLKVRESPMEEEWRGSFRITVTIQPEAPKAH